MENQASKPASSLLFYFGSADNHETWIKRVAMQHPAIRIKDTARFTFMGVEKVNQCVEVDHFTEEEIMERIIYGDPDHESYLLSEDYEADQRMERMDWIKNEER